MATIYLKEQDYRPLMPDKVLWERTVDGKPIVSIMLLMIFSFPIGFKAEPYDAENLILTPPNNYNVRVTYTCSECHKKFKDSSNKCPHCGVTFDEFETNINTKTSPSWKF